MSKSKLKSRVATESTAKAAKPKIKVEKVAQAASTLDRKAKELIKKASGKHGKLRMDPIDEAESEKLRSSLMEIQNKINQTVDRFEKLDDKLNKILKMMESSISRADMSQSLSPTSAVSTLPLTEVARYRSSDNAWHALEGPTKYTGENKNFDIWIESFEQWLTSSTSQKEKLVLLQRFLDGKALLVVKGFRMYADLTYESAVNHLHEIEGTPSLRSPKKEPNESFHYLLITFFST